MIFHILLKEFYSYDSIVEEALSASDPKAQLNEHIRPY
jgi:hypothetical protein